MSSIKSTLHADVRGEVVTLFLKFLRWITINNSYGKGNEEFLGSPNLLLYVL